MEEGKKSSIGKKLHGNPSFESGPGKHKPHDFQHREPGMSPGSVVQTGPRRNDASIGKNVKGKMSGGTKAAEKGEDSGGVASGKRGNVKA